MASAAASALQAHPMGLLLRPCCWNSRHTQLLHRACRASSGLAEALRESTCLVVCPLFCQALQCMLFSITLCEPAEFHFAQMCAILLRYLGSIAACS